MTPDGHTMRAPEGEASERLRTRLATHRWTAHNLELAPDVWTMPGSPDLVKADPRLKAILQMCRALYGARLSTLRMLDLGCLEGGYSVGLARAGAQVLGIEAREEHLEKCMLARDALALPGLEFACADVKAITVDRFGSFDAVLALGILYHLDDPVGWLRQIAALTRGILFVDTHYAPVDEASLAAVRPGLRGQLGLLERFDSHGLAVAGRWYREWAVEAERDTMPWASWSNPRSLWLTKESLARAMRHAGFDVVAEQYDHWLDRYEVFTTEYPRTMMIGLKSPSSG
jgi:SAM-dependent methyltransferase